MDIAQFSQRVQNYRRSSGHTQQELADLLGFQRQVLGRKFSGKNVWFNLKEIKQIIKTLAEWQAITTQGQVGELLRFIDLKPEIFSDEEWHSKPLSQLEQANLELADKPIPNPASFNKTSNSGLGRYNNLPAPLTSLIGREGDVEKVGQILLQPTPRLLTLVGPGGCGKTRLAVEIGQHYGSRFNQGVCFVSLAEVSDPSFIVAAISQGLGLVSSETLDPFQNLQDFLAHQQLLLILDNFEHLLAGAGLIEILLKTAPGLKILVTSRSVLHLYGEQEYAVSTLAFPGPGQVVNSSNSRQFEAIRLFEERAQAVKPGFNLSDETAGLVARICELLDGLPLSIELAASRVKLLSLEILLERLTAHQLDFLGGGATGLPQRHKTLRDTLDWSYGLLNYDNKQLFRMLGIFRGNFSVEAVQAIFAGETFETFQVLERLGTLVDNSLVQVVQPDQPSLGFEMAATRLVPSTRFRLLATIREYAFEQLVSQGDLLRYRRAQIHYYETLCGQLEEQLNGPEQVSWLGLLEAAYANIRSTLDMALALAAKGSASDRRAASLAGLAICRNLSIFLDIRGQFVEGQAIANQFVAAARQNGLADTTAFAWGVCWEGIFNGRLFRYDLAYQMLEESRKMFAALGEKRGEAVALIFQGTFASMQGESLQARQFFGQAKEICCETGDKKNLGEILMSLGILERRKGDYSRSASLLHQGLQLFREQSNKRLMALVLFNLGITAEMHKEYVASKSYYSECIELYSEQVDNRGLSYTIRCLGKIAYFLGDYTSAQRQMTESLGIAYRFGDKVEVALNLALLAIVNVTKAEVESGGNIKEPQLGYLRTAAQLIGSSEAQYKEAHTALLPIYNPVYTDKIGKARAWLGEQTYNSYYLKGQTSSLAWIENGRFGHYNSQ